MFSHLYALIRECVKDFDIVSAKDGENDGERAREYACHNRPFPLGAIP